MKEGRLVDSTENAFDIIDVIHIKQTNHLIDLTDEDCVKSSNDFYLKNVKKK